MRKITPAILGAMLALSLHAAPAQATSLRTWVASNGTNNATCDRTTPCDTFQHAHDATTAGGKLSCVDAGDYGPLTINKSISIVCDNTNSGIFIIAGSAIVISAGVSDIITLKGLDIDGGGSALIGIVFNTGAALHVHKVHIRNFRPNSTLASGIHFRPSNYAELYVADSYITDNGGPAQPLNGGIVIAPTSSGSANVSLSRVRLENNSTGILLDGSGSTGVAVNLTMLDSAVVGSAHDGVLAQSTAGHAAASVFFDHSVASGNFGSGVQVDGAAASGQGSAIARMGDSTIVLNVTGVSATGAGIVQSFKNNRISGNSTDGTPITAFPGPGGSALQ